MPVVVLVPGGSWRSADRTGLRPLAAALTGAGMFAVDASYRAADAGVRFPVPVADIECAVDFAVARARQTGHRLGPIVLLGHSAGAQLAALVALAADRFASACPYPRATVSAFAGLSGAYLISQLGDLPTALFGRSQREAPALWAQGDPVAYAARNPTLPVLLVHGVADYTLPDTVTTIFGQDLARGGHPLRVRLLPGVTHASVYQPGVVAPTLINWIRTLR
jgi:acetyl esterase/lipase